MQLCLYSGLIDDIIHFTEIDFGEMDFGEIDLGEIHFGILEALMGMVFRGRTVELGVLNKKFRQQGFVMTVVYGRRRVGKTKLINQFMHQHDCRRISFTAVEREESELLSMMTEAVLLALSPELVGNIQFASFEKLFDYVGKQAEKERIIFFIDE